MSTASPIARSRSLVSKIFFGPRELRAGWRFLLFVLLLQLLQFLTDKLVDISKLIDSRGWTATFMLVTEGLQLVLTMIAVFVMSRIEGRSFARYGLPARGILGARFWEGTLWGLLTVSLLVGLIAAFGGYSVRGFALHGAALVHSAVMWAVVMVVLGVFEELLFRGYPQLTLTTGIGFWPAALLMSALFAGLHYFGKPMENAADALSVGLIGVFCCLTLRRTGSLWWAIGFHFAFDYAALVVFGAPNTGNQGRPIADHLLDSSWHGPDWLTGGPRGAEASLLVFVVIAALFAIFPLIHREKRFPLEPDRRSARSPGER